MILRCQRPEAAQLHSHSGMTCDVGSFLTKSTNDESNDAEEQEDREENRLGQRYPTLR